MTKPKLDPRSARTDLTSRELSKLLGGFLGTLIQLADVEAIKTAMQWWIETPTAWEQLEALKKLFAASDPTDESRSNIQ